MILFLTVNVNFVKTFPCLFCGLLMLALSILCLKRNVIFNGNIARLFVLCSLCPCLFNLVVLGSFVPIAGCT